MGKAKNDTLPPLPLAPFRQRVSAFIIDMIIFSVLVVTISTPLTTTITDRTLDSTVWSDPIDFEQEMEEFLRLQRHLETIQLGIYALVGIGYLAVVPSFMNGRTIGKLANGLQIVRADGSPVTFSVLLLRNVIGYSLSNFIMSVGFLMAFADSEKRALHDRLAGTRVIIADRKNK